MGISGRAFIALHTLHLVGQFIALHMAQRRFISSPEFLEANGSICWTRSCPSSDGIISSEPNTYCQGKSGRQNKFFQDALMKFQQGPKFVLHLVFITEFIEFWVSTSSCCCSLGFINKRNLVENSSSVLILTSINNEEQRRDRDGDTLEVFLWLFVPVCFPICEKVL